MNKIHRVNESERLADNQLKDGHDDVCYLVQTFYNHLKTLNFVCVISEIESWLARNVDGILFPIILYLFMNIVGCVFSNFFIYFVFGGCNEEIFFMLEI